MYESAYLAKLDQRMAHVGDVPEEMKIVKDDFIIPTEGGGNEHRDTPTEGGVNVDDATLTEGGVEDKVVAPTEGGVSCDMSARVVDTVPPTLQ